MVHVTDMKRTLLMEQVADDYEQLGNQGRFSKKCIPRGYIPDLNWTTKHKHSNQPIKPVKQEEDPTEATTTPAAPLKVEAPPSSLLRSKTKQQMTPTQQDPPERNPSMWWTHWNTIQLKQKSTKCNCTKRLFFNAMDTYTLMGQGSLKT